MEETSTTYQTDRDDRITQVDEHWTHFAEANKAPQLHPQRVIGRPLFDFICVPGNRHIYQMLMSRVRQSGRELSFPFRCDAPDKRRFMQMDIAPLADGGLSFTSRIMREEMRAPVALLDTDTPRSDQFLAICSWCKQVRIDDSQTWVEVEEAIDRLGLFDVATLPQLTHGICPSCYDKALKQG